MTQSHSREARPDPRPRIFKALAHPLRMRLLAALSERESSPSELAVEFDEPLGNVSYHIKTLEELGCIELVRTTPARGALQHHYRAVVRPVISDDAWARVPSSARPSISAGIRSEIWRDLAQAVSDGAFDKRQDRHLSWTNLVLDEQGWNDMTELLAGVVERATEIQGESEHRLQADGSEGAVTTKLVLAHYEPAPKESGAPSKKGGRKTPA
jgi:DNA-binding transcriptional ArsR family regulator